MQHHGVVELATRLERRGLLRRYHDQRDGRHARLALTPQGARWLRELVEQESARLRSYDGRPSPPFGASSPGCRKMATAAERRGMAIEMDATVAQARSDLTYD